MRSSHLRIYGEIKWSCIKCLANEKDETGFTEKLKAVFKISSRWFIFCVAPLDY
ncbi:MAG: hypothetical protein RLZZ417_2858 [Bacteroidota bacterium]